MSVTYLTTPIVEVRNDPPPHGSGLTRDGYTKSSGAPTARMIRLQGEKRWRRLMVWQFSNLGTLFVRIAGEPHVVREEMIPQEHHATKKTSAQLNAEIAASLGGAASAHATKKRKPRIVNVEAATPTGYRWLRQHARGATTMSEGFVVTNEADWAQSLRAANAKEI